MATAVRADAGGMEAGGEMEGTAAVEAKYGLVLPMP